MKTRKNLALLNVPREITVLNDDSYLVEMTERLRRLRSLLSEQQVEANAAS